MGRDARNQRDARTPKPSLGVAIELCAGLGGIGLGLRELGLDVRHAYDAWSTAIDVYNSNDESQRAKVCDLLSNSGRRMIASDVKALGGVALLAAGPPCKGFSQIKNGRHDGRRADNRTHNRVLKSIPSYVALVKPRMVLVENVPALETHRDGKTLRELIKGLAEPSRHLSYDVSYHIYDAAEFGTPQSRRRLLVLAVRKGERALVLPQPGVDMRQLFSAIRRGSVVPGAMEKLAESLANPSTIAPTTVAQALSDLPLRRAGDLTDTASYASKPTSAFQKRMRLSGSTIVTGMRTPGVKEDTVQRLGHIPPGGCVLDIPEAQRIGLARSYHSAYRRLHPDAPSTALSTKYDCVYHYSLPRSLSLREYARLQGIPDWFRFSEDVVARRAAYEMIGNSVPPQLIEGVLGRTFEAWA
jgi:DNA (cytosine-5)-methyltransferase 1